MPRQGGQGKGKPKMSDRGFGKSLMKKQMLGEKGLWVVLTSVRYFIQLSNSIYSRNGVQVKQKGNLKSILDNSSLEDFVNTAIMDGKDIEVKR
jgi:hypothetical protein